MTFSQDFAWGVAYADDPEGAFGIFLSRNDAQLFVTALEKKETSNGFIIVDMRVVGA